MQKYHGKYACVQVKYIVKYNTMIVNRKKQKIQ